MIKQEDIQTFREQQRILIHTEAFIYLLPHLGLRAWISNYTVTFPDEYAMSEDYTIIPHGSATLVISYDTKSIYVTLFGPTSKPCIVGNHANSCEMLTIIEFQPAGLFALTGINQKELTDIRLPLELVNTKLNRQLIEIVEKAQSLYQLVTDFDELFLTNIIHPFSSQLKLAVHKIIKDMGNVSVKNLSDTVHYSERQLNRIFEQNIGMNIKSFSRLVRINKAIDLLNNPDSSITLVSDISGFYDVSHFARDFKLVCGITPQQYRHKMSDFYSEIAKF